MIIPRRPLPRRMWGGTNTRAQLSGLVVSCARNLVIQQGLRLGGWRMTAAGRFRRSLSREEMAANSHDAAFSTR